MSINYSNHIKETPMIIAAREGMLPFIMWMHDTYPDKLEVNRKTAEGWTAWHYACNNGFINTMEYLMDDLECDIHT
jgi:ankyrin repeat protein